MKKRVTVMIDDKLDKKIRLLQAKKYKKKIPVIVIHKQ